MLITSRHGHEISWTLFYIYILSASVSAQLNVLLTKQRFLSLRGQSAIVSSDTAADDAGWDW